MGYRFTGTFKSCPFKQVYVPHDKPYVGRPVGRREEFLQLASHKIPGLLYARVDCWRPYRSEPKRLFYFAQTKIFKIFLCFLSSLVVTAYIVDDVVLFISLAALKHDV